MNFSNENNELGPVPIYRYSALEAEGNGIRYMYSPSTTPEDGWSYVDTPFYTYTTSHGSTVPIYRYSALEAHGAGIRYMYSPSPLPEDGWSYVDTPFYAFTAGIDAVDFWENALLAANMAALAYENRTTIEQTLLTNGYTLYQFYDTSADTQAFLAYTPGGKRIILAFRGTWEFTDLNIDLWLEQVQLSPEIGTDVKVIAGFNFAYSSIEKQLMDDVVKVVDILGGPQELDHFFITGHSLGGALAAYATLQLALLLDNHYQWHNGYVLQMITFGAPAVGNRGFRDLWNRMIAKNAFSGFVFYDPTDPIPNGDFTRYLPIKFNPEAWGYYNVETRYELPAGNLIITHSIASYIELVKMMKGRTGRPISSLTGYITTGTGSVAPWWVPDTPGTDRDVTFTLGQPGGPVATWNLNNWGNDFEAGNTDEFILSNPRQFTTHELKYYAITIDVSGGVFSDNWMLDGVRIVVNGAAVYNRQNMHKLLGPDYNWSFTDTISPHARRD